MKLIRLPEHDGATGWEVDVELRVALITSDGMRVNETDLHWRIVSASPEERALLKAGGYDIPDAEA